MVSPVTPYDPGQPCCRVSDSGSGMGAASFRQTRSVAVTLAVRASLSWADMLKQATRTPACPVRDEEAAGSCKGLRRLISAGVPGLHEHPRLVR